MRAHEPLAQRVGQLGKSTPDRVDPGRLEIERQEIGLGEVAIVVRLLLAPHRLGHVPGRVPEQRILGDAPARFHDVDLPPDLELDRLLDEAERVHVLDLGLRPERGRSARTDGDVGITAEAPLLHVPVADVEIDQDLPELREVAHRFRPRADVGLGDDLDQRHAGAVQVDPRGFDAFTSLGVERLARVLLEVDPDEPDPLVTGAVIGRDLDVASFAERTIVL